MRDLIRHEQFELEILEKLHSQKLLNHLVFVGGAMLRLCHGLERYSVDLDFWLLPGTKPGALFQKIKKTLGENYVLKDAAQKFNTLLFEIKSTNYPSSLKIEIRKKTGWIQWEETIAYSPAASLQVMLKTLPLAEMFQAKIAAFLNRSEIRDVFDLEFMIKKGVAPVISKKETENLLQKIALFKKTDYTVKLGSLLPPAQRAYYNRENFKILKATLEHLHS